MPKMWERALQLYLPDPLPQVILLGIGTLALIGVWRAVGAARGRAQPGIASTPVFRDALWTSAALLLPACLLAPPGRVADPLGKAVPKLGKKHHDKLCMTGHVRLYGGNGSKMYTRDNRLLSTKLDILKRVATCNAQTKVGLLLTEEAEVAAYLNQQYYHFKE